MRLTWFDYNMNQFNNLLPVGLLARILVERCTVSQRSRVRIPYKSSLTFFRLSFRNYESCLYICDDFLSYKRFCTTDINAGCPKFDRFQANALRAQPCMMIVDNMIQ